MPENQTPENTTIDLGTPDGEKALRSMMELILDKETKTDEERSSIEIDPNADQERKPSVKGEFVEHWRIRGFKAIQAQAGIKHNDVSKARLFASRFVEQDRKFLAMHDDQRAEEEKEARAIVDRAVKQGRINVDAQERILNILDDPLERQFLSDSRAAGHSGLSGPNGEFLIPKPMLAKIHTIIEEYGLAQRLATNITLQGSGNSLDLTSIMTAPEASWLGEDQLFPVSNMDLDQNVLTVYKLGAVSSISMELEEDKLVPLIPAWIQKIGENIAKKIDESYLVGDGTSAYGLMTGIANLSNVQSFTAGAGDLAPADIVENDLDQVVRLLTTARRLRAQWVMARVLWDYVRKFESTVGARIVQEMLTTLPQQTYDGFPVNLSEALDNTNGDVASRDFAILGDFSRSYLGTKRGVTVETSTEGVLSNAAGVVQQNAFQQESMLIKISLRTGHQTPVDVQDGFAILNAPAS